MHVHALNVVLQECWDVEVLLYLGVLDFITLFSGRVLTLQSESTILVLSTSIVSSCFSTFYGIAASLHATRGASIAEFIPNMQIANRVTNSYRRYYDTCLFLMFMLQCE